MKDTAIATTLAAEPAARAPAQWRKLLRFNWRGALSLLAFFLAWHLAVRFSLAGFHEIPAPLIVARTLFDEFLPAQDYWMSWAVSFKRVFLGFLLAQLLGIPLGLFLGSSAVLRAAIFPVFEMLRPIPPLAWVPLSILFWPTNEASIIFITFVGAFFIITINVFEGVRSIRPEHVWLARSLGASSFQIFRRIMLPAVIPSIAVGMTLGIAVTWNVVIAAEMIASDSGLGRLTWEGYVSSTPTVVIVGMISIGIAGYLSTTLVDRIERRMMPWEFKR